MKNEGEGAASFCIRTAGGGAVKLAMQELWVSGQICPVGARLVVRHVFESRETKPLEAVYAFGLPRLGRSLRFVPGALLTPYLTIYILVRSALVVVRSGGISWRGRFYPLAELKKSRPLFW